MNCFLVGLAHFCPAHVNILSLEVHQTVSKAFFLNTILVAISKKTLFLTDYVFSVSSLLMQGQFQLNDLLNTII